jgi:hypothetical protein
MDEDERAELIAALQQSAVFNEGMLTLNERLLEALSPGANPPDAEEIEYMRAALGRWQGADGNAMAADGEPDDPAAGSDSMSRTGAVRSARARTDSRLRFVS